MPPDRLEATLIYGITSLPHKKILYGTLILSGEIFDFHSHRECVEEEYEYANKDFKTRP